VPSQTETKLLDALYDPDRYKLSATPQESAEEVAARLRRESDEAEHRRRQELLLTWAGVVFTGIVLFISLIVALLPLGSSEDKAHAWAILNLVVGAFIGFLTGRKFLTGPSA
jgi:hypothetical protein